MNKRNFAKIASSAIVLFSILGSATPAPAAGSACNIQSNKTIDTSPSPKWQKIEFYGFLGIITLSILVPELIKPIDSDIETKQIDEVKAYQPIPIKPNVEWLQVRDSA